MSLKDTDRPALTFHYEPWAQDLVFRPIGAKDFIDIAGRYGDLDGVDADSESVITFYAALLAATCESPRFAQDEWLEARGPTLIELGMKALHVNGMAKEEAKKNSPTPSTDSPSSSAGS